MKENIEKLAEYGKKLLKENMDHTLKELSSFIENLKMYPSRNFEIHKLSVEITIEKYRKIQKQYEECYLDLEKYSKRFNELNKLYEAYKK